MLRSLRSWPTWMWCTLLVALEAALILGPLGQAGMPILGGDGPSYDRLAHNLVAHGVFSLESAAPWTPTVYRSPGYPGFLVALHAVGLGSVVGVRIAQFALLAGAAVLAGRVVTEAHGPRAGRVAAALCATYLPLLWLATHHVTEVLASLLTLALVAGLLRARRDRSPRAWALAGVVFAALVYVRPSLLLLAGPLAMAAVVSGDGAWRSSRRWLPALAFGVAVALCIAPWMARNAALVHRVLPMSSASGGSLWISAEQWTGRIAMDPSGNDWVRIKAETRDAMRPYRDRGFGPVDQIEGDAAFAARARWGDVGVGDIAGRLPARLGALWGPVDVTPDAERWSASLRSLGQLQWMVLAALGLAGAWLRRRRLLDDWPLWIVGAYLTALHLVFHVEPRYTIPARPMLFAYAAVGAVALADWRARARGGARARVGAGAGADRQDPQDQPVGIQNGEALA